MRLNLARLLHRSAANGPGERFVIWVQGCPLACPGCWNPDTWPFERRLLRTVEQLVTEILSVQGIEGVTFTGGEPFLQARALAAVARAVRSAGLSVFVFTGYDREELVWDAARELLSLTDVLISGRYLESERVHDLPWRSSSNQQLHLLSDRYAAPAPGEAPEAEIHITPDGTLVLTGFPPAELRNPTELSTDPLPPH